MRGSSVTRPRRARVIGFQELFHGSYLGITQDKRYYRLAAPVDGTILGKYRKNHLLHVEKFWEKVLLPAGGDADIFIYHLAGHTST
jgi:predicted amidohydrolase